MKVQLFLWDEGDTILIILTLGSRWKWMIRFTSLPLCSREKGPRHPLNGRLGERKMRSESFGEEKDHLPLSEVENRILGSPQNALYQLPNIIIIIIIDNFKGLFGRKGGVKIDANGVDEAFQRFPRKTLSRATLITQF